MINYQDTISNFRSAMHSSGIMYDGPIHIDSEGVERFQCNCNTCKSGSNQNGSYRLYSNHSIGIPAGWYQCWKSGVKKNWCAKDDKQFTLEDRRRWTKHIEQAKRDQKVEKEKRHTEAAEEAKKLWDGYEAASDNHEYLTDKNCRSYNLRVTPAPDSSLVIPLVNNNDEICSLQFISLTSVKDGKKKFNKKFMPGGEVKSNYHIIGEKYTKTIYIAEGYATAYTIHAVTNCMVIVAFDCGNLLAVGLNIKKRFPDAEIIFIADNDAYNPPHNPGITKAKEAAAKLATKYVYPQFEKFDKTSEPTDFNDLMMLSNEDEVLRQLNNPETFELSAKEAPAESEFTKVEGDSDEAMRRINQLASLSLIKYAKQRNLVSKELGINVGALDGIVKEARKQNDANANDDIFPVVEPWPEEVNLSELLHELMALIDCFMVFESEYELIAIVLWIIHTHCINAANITPILNINSPEKRCGKSNLLTILNRLVHRPLLASNVTTASVYRSIEKWRPTILIDEADSFMKENDELRGIINAGNNRETAFTLRCDGQDNEPRKFNTFGPKAIAGIGHLADTIEDRSIQITLRRKLDGEERQSLHYDDKAIFIGPLRKCARFAQDNMEALKAIKPEKSGSLKELNDRAFDCWSPLLAIALHAGNKWYANAIEAAQFLSGSKNEPMSVRVELLHDIKNILDERKLLRISAADLLTYLCLDEDKLWKTFGKGGGQMNPRQLAKILADFKIKKGSIKDGGTVKKGYQREWLEEAFKRYVPSPEDN